MDYSLNINIEPAGVQAIQKSNQNIAIVKSVLGGTPSPGVVLWLSFAPQMSNLVSWTENYTVYETYTQIQHGATIVQSSFTPAPIQVGMKYPFQYGIFQPPIPGTAGYFGIVNNQGMTQTFGLAQQAVVNGEVVNAPLNAVTVMAGETVLLEPEETLSVFLYTQSDNGTVISAVSSSQLVVTLTSVTPSATIGFNAANSAFYVQ